MKTLTAILGLLLSAAIVAILNFQSQNAELEISVLKMARDHADQLFIRKMACNLEVSEASNKIVIKEVINEVVKEVPTACPASVVRVIQSEPEVRTEVVTQVVKEQPKVQVVGFAGVGKSDTLEINGNNVRLEEFYHPVLGIGAGVPLNDKFTVWGQVQTNGTALIGLGVGL